MTKKNIKQVYYFEELEHETYPYKPISITFENFICCKHGKRYASVLPVPVCAMPITSFPDIIGVNAMVGALSEDLGDAARRAMRLEPQTCRSFAAEFSWEACTRQFLANLAQPADEATIDG